MSVIAKLSSNSPQNRFFRIPQMGTRSSLAGMEVPFLSTDALKWINISVPSSSSSSTTSTSFAPPTHNASACSLIYNGDSPTYLIWRIHESMPHELELVELSACKELPTIGLRIKFPDALSPYAFIFKDEVSCEPNNLYLLYALTVSGVAYLFKLQNFSAYAPCSIFRHDALIEFDLKTYHNRGAITTIAATAGSFLAGRSDGSISCFQLGILDQNAPSFVHELRDDAGLGRLWGLVSRNWMMCAMQSLIISEVEGNELAFALHLDGTLRIWDILGRNRLFSQTTSSSSSAGSKVIRLWVGQADSKTSTLPLAILYRHDEEVSVESIYIYSLHYILGERIHFSLDPSSRSIPVEEGELIDVKLMSEKIWILKEDGLISHDLFHSIVDVEEAHIYSLQEVFVADQLFQNSGLSSDDLLWICHSVFSAAKEKIVSFLSSIFLRRLLQPGVYDCYVLRSTLQDYNRHCTDAEIQSLTVDGVKKEILSLIDHEGTTGNPISIFHCWKGFCSRYFHYWCRNSTPYGLVVESSSGAIGLIRKQSISLFRCLENIEMLCDGSFAEVNDSITYGFDFPDDEAEREILLDVLRCASTVSQQLGKVSSVIVYESLVNPSIIGSIEIVPSLLNILESGYSSSVTVPHMSDLGSDIVVWEKQLMNHKKLRKFSVEMLLSLCSLCNKASTWARVLEVIENYVKYLVPCKIMRDFNFEVLWTMSTSISVLASSQIAKLMLESSSNVLLLLNYLLKTSGQIHMLDDDLSRIQLELVPMIQEIIMEWIVIHFLATTSSECPTIEEFSCQLSSLNIDGNADRRSWNEKLGKCDFSLAYIILLNFCKSSAGPTHKYLPNPQKCVSLARNFTSWVIWGSSGEESFAFFKHSADVAVILLRHGQYDAVENLLTIVDAHSRKEKTSEIIQDIEGEWCASLHLLGCCLLARACTLHGVLKEQKVAEAVRCFFRASSGEGACKALQSLSNEIGLLRLSVDCVSFAAWKLQYYQWAMQIFEQYGISGAACQFALAALEQVDEALIQEKDSSERDSSMESATTIKGRLWANVFKFSLDLNQFFDAYCAIITNPDAESKYICLRRFIIVLYESGSAKILCSGQLPFIGLTDKVERELAWKAQRSDISEKSNPYKLLYAFEMHRHNWRRAANYLYLYSIRLKAEMTSTDYQYQSVALQERLNGISAAINALRLVHPACAWIDPLPEEYSMYNEHYPIKKTKRTVDEQTGIIDRVLRLHTYVDVEKLEKEFVLTSAEYSLLLYNVKWTHVGIDKLPSDLVDLLIQKNLYDMVFTVLLKFWKGSALKRELERVFYAMSLKCCPTSNKAGYSVVRDDSSTKGLLLTSSTNEAVVNDSPHLDPKQQSEGHGQWEILELYLEKYKCFNARLPVIVAETLLHANPRIELPLWLVNMFKVGGRGKTWGMTGEESNPASLLRIYVDYGRYTEATHMLLDYIKSYSTIRPADIIYRKRSSAVWFPYTTIEHLWCQLDKLIRLGHMVDQCNKLKRLLHGALQNHLNLLKMDSEDALSSAFCQSEGHN